MCNLDVLQTSPQRSQIYRFANQGSKKRDALHPCQRPRERRIDRNKLRFNRRIVLPVAQEQLCLY